MLFLPLETRYVTVGTDANQQEPAHWSRILIALAIAFVLVTTISFLLRLYSRRKTTWKPALEDVFMGIGIVFSYLLSACVIIAALNGVGYNIWALPRQTQGRVSLIFWLGQKFWVLAHVFVKISIIFLIRRLLSIVGPWQEVTTGLIVFTVAWGITAIVGNALQCLPPRYFWIRTIDGKCNDNQEAFAITMGSLALAEDVVLLVIPIVIVWRMKLARPEKIRITILFAFGGLVCIFGILRVVELVNYQTDNLTGRLTPGLEIILANELDS
ncbi:glutathione S-transferase [Penicillium atrosanguineum]|uniref:glutathione S-transferase n=1 Tax=Penicillium atrosanguineum TaxID=1132637 RepID=UPI002384EEB7|nr:glutathione S-transferase [Penicillium atrosanguineum]KAJ5304423.1 glutathione S-transferase [Penicillium atrosanguineum]